MRTQVIGHFLFLFGLSLWIGGLIFLAYGVAPVNFSAAKEWQIQGENPNFPNLAQNHRNIAGEITARSIERLNHLEFMGMILCTMGLFFFWYPRFNRPNLLITQTMVLVVMILLYIMYAIVISGQLAEIRAEVPLDFLQPEGTPKSPARLQFDNLHRWYTRLSVMNLALGVVLLMIAAAQYSGVRYGTKEILQ